MTTNHIMVDLETLGVAASSAIVAIGAIQFDPNTGETGQTFNVNIDLQSNFDVGRTMDASTVQWWLEQDKAAIGQTFVENGLRLEVVLSAFTNFVKLDTPSLAGIWGNGSDFDVALLRDAYRSIGEPVPWGHRDVRDVRTIVHLAQGLVDKNDFEFEGPEHNALDDAKHQAKYVSAMWQALHIRGSLVGQGANHDHK